MEDEHSTLWFVFLGTLITLALSGLTMVLVGEVTRRRGAEPGAWLLIGFGVAVLLVPAIALTIPPLLP